MEFGRDMMVPMSKVNQAYEWAGRASETNASGAVVGRRTHSFIASTSSLHFATDLAEENILLW